LLVAAMIVGAHALRAQDDADSAGQDATDDQKEQNPLEYALMKTSSGHILLELNREKAPVTVANFLKYAEADFYDGTTFHRVIESFMIQGGGFTRSMLQKTADPPIKNEFANGLSNTRGTIAMARTSDPDSATSQFFINVVDNTALDKADPRFGGAGYCVFGKVIAGMDTVDKIKTVKTTTVNGHRDVPVESVVIEDVQKVTKERAEELKQEIGGA